MLTVLVVDDEQAVRENLAAYLEDEGMQITEAESGEQALDLEKHLTMLYGVIDLEANVLRFANGGQFPFPILFDGHAAAAIGHKSMPVGLFRHANYTVEERELPEKFLLLLCSDGVLELMPQPRVEDKEAALLAMVANLGLSLEQMLSSIGVETHQDELPDDVTLLAVRR